MSSSVSEINPDGRQQGRMQKYTDFWDTDLAQDDQQHTENRRENYADVVNGYYDAATLLYEYPWSSSFHFSRFYKGEGFTAALARHEHYLAAQMNLRPGMRVLDVGCGVGGPARQIARFADVNIVGLNNNHYQISRAIKHTQNAGLEGQVKYVEGDFMKLSEYFDKNTFDAGMYPSLKYRRGALSAVTNMYFTVYAIESTIHAPSWEAVYGEIKKVLKPGGVVSHHLCLCQSTLLSHHLLAVWCL